MQKRRLRVRDAVAGTFALAFAVSAAEAAGAENCPPCPPPPPPGWNVSVGGGLSLTGGNSDTSSYTLSANASYDPKTRNVFRTEALYLRAAENGRATVDRTLASVRDEYKLGDRAFVFGQIGFQRDHFKEVDYLFAPIAGVGYRVVDRKTLLLAVDGGAGGAFEKLQDRDSTTNVALQASERLEWQLRPAARLFQKSAGLWKAEDLGDAYYRAEIGVATTLAKWLELKLAFADDYKARPARVELKKSDTSFLASVLLKP
jgi:putative salt-induced outer membrane protein YdiY